MISHELITTFFLLIYFNNSNITLLILSNRHHYKNIMLDYYIIFTTLIISILIECLNKLIPFIYPINIINPELIKLRNNIKLLKIKEESLNSMSTFVQLSKVQREINSLIMKESNLGILYHLYINLFYY